LQTLTPLNLERAKLVKGRNSEDAADEETATKFYAGAAQGEIKGSYVWAPSKFRGRSKQSKKAKMKLWKK